MSPEPSAFSMPPMRCSRPGVPGIAHGRARVRGSRVNGLKSDPSASLSAGVAKEKSADRSGRSETSGTRQGSEPWRIPEVSALPDLSAEFEFASEADKPADGSDFLPFKRDPKTLARPWAVPGTPGLEHRIGGIEKADGTGDISYDPDNHDTMVRLRQAKIDGIAGDISPVEVDDPDGSARVLVLGWGSTYGSIGAAVRRVRTAGGSVAQAHLRHLSPFPANLGDVLRSYDKVLVPEINLGQLALLLRGRYLVDVVSYNRVRGLPFKAAELANVIQDVISNV